METDYKKLWELERQERYAHHANATALLGFNEKLLAQNKDLTQEVKELREIIDNLLFWASPLHVDKDKVRAALAKAAEHHMHPTSGEATVNGALSAPENQPSNVAESTPPTRG